MSDKVLTDAMDEVLLWGPERMVPEEDRLKAKHLGLSDNDAKEAIRAARLVLNEATSMAPGIKQGRGEQDAGRILQSQRPWLTSDQAGRAISQALYYHWRETGM